MDGSEVRRDRFPVPNHGADCSGPNEVLAVCLKIHSIVEKARIYGGDEKEYFTSRSCVWNRSKCTADRLTVITHRFSYLSIINLVFLLEGEKL